MRKIFVLLAAASVAGLFGATTVTAGQAEALIKQCEQQSQGAADINSAVSKCLDDKLQYDPAQPSGEG